MSNVSSVSDATFDQDVKESAVPVLVDFWAPWCGPCKKLGPVLDEVSAELGDKVKIVKINVDENQKKATEFGISGIPAMIIFVKGEIVDRLVGLQPKSQIESTLKKYL